MCREGGAILMRRSSLKEWQHGTELIDDGKLTRTLLSVRMSVHVAFNYLYSRTSQYMPIKGKR